jgi:glycosyltransferase involved in cell wall biosynthesis
MFCSTIIPSIGRATLRRTVESVLAQEFDAGQHEVIVVNDSGQPLPPLGFEHDPRVQIVTTGRRERSVARNTGAAIARGAYLHFLDDDDWLVPGAMAALHDLAVRHPQAGFLYGATQVVDRQSKPILQLRPHQVGNCAVQTMAGEWIPLQASLIKSSAFYAVGGFNVLITGPEDIDLLRRIALTWDLAETDAIVATVGMGADNSSTNYTDHPRQSRIAREQILNQDGVFSRMRASAATPAWQGRLTRIYATSAIWNFQRGRWLTALSRLLAALWSLAAAGSALLHGSYWRALRRPYASETFARGFAAAQPGNVP